VLHQDTTIDGAAQSYSVIFADPKKFIVADSTSINLNSLASAFFSGEQVSMGVNNASASATLSLITPKVYDATAATGDIPVLQNLGGNIEFASPASILAAATTNTLGSVINTLTSTVNGVVATAPIINTNVLSLDATNQLVSTVNGIASTALPIFTSDTVDNGLSIGADNRIELGGKLHQATNIDQAGYDLTITDGLVGIGTAAPAYTLDIAGMLNQTTILPSGRTTSVHSGDNVIGDRGSAGPQTSGSERAPSKQRRGRPKTSGTSGFSHEQSITRCDPSSRDGRDSTQWHRYLFRVDPPHPMAQWFL
jgi:hypothetical protein